MKKLLILIIMLMQMLLAAEESYAIYRRPAQITPYYHYLMARVHINMGRIKEAIRSLERARRYGKSWSVDWDLLELYYITGLYYKARDLAGHMCSDQPENPKLLELLADIYANTNDYEKSIETYKKLLELKPASNLARFNLATLYEKNKEYKSAIAEYTIVLDNDPKNMYARLALADAYLEIKKYNAAIKNYRESMKYGASVKEINIQIAKIYNLKHNYKKSRKYLEDNIEKYPDDLQSYFLLVELLKKQKKDSEAEELLLGLKSRPESKLNVLLRLGTMYSDSDEIEKALDVFKELTETYKDEYTGWYLLGLTYEYLEKYEAALDAYKKAERLKKDAQLYFHIAVIYDRLGKRDEVSRYLNECLALNPSNPAANNYIGYTYAEQGIKLAEAEQHVLRALESEPENEAYLDSLGWVYYQQERYDEAVEQLEKAASKTKDHLILEHLGDAYSKLDRRDDAIRSYKKALELEPENSHIKEKLNTLET